MRFGGTLKENSSQEELNRRLITHIGHLEEEVKNWKEQCEQLQEQNAKLMELSKEERNYSRCEQDWKEQIDNLSETVRDQKAMLQSAWSDRKIAEETARQARDQKEKACLDEQAEAWLYINNKMYKYLNVGMPGYDRDDIEVKDVKKSFVEQCRLSARRLKTCRILVLTVVAETVILMINLL